MTADHPASPEAQVGRLAGPPAALRPGAAEVPPPHRTEPVKTAAPVPQGHEGHH